MAMTISNMVNSGFNYNNFFNATSINQNATQKSISNLWNTYSSAQTNSTSTIAGLQEVRTNAAALVSSYDEAKNAFYDEFDTNMENLSNSAQEVKEFDFESVAAFSAASKVVEAASETASKNAEETAAQSTTAENVEEETSAAAKVIENANKHHIVQSEFGATVLTDEEAGKVVNTDGSVTTTNEDGSRVTSYGNGAITKTETYDNEGNKRIETAYSKVMQSALKTVQDFVDNYNGAIEFFQDNSSVSARVGRMAELFGDTTYRASSYESIGIGVNNDGTLSMDTEKVAQAIVNNPSRVSDVLGGTGLADKAEAHVDVANSQRSQLFPSAQAMFGEELSTASFYTSGAYLNMNAASNLGNLVNMMF